MGEAVQLKRKAMKALRTLDLRYLSYNIEMTEVTGGTFWSSYTPEQIDGTEEFPPIMNWQVIKNLHKYYEPADLSHPRLRAMAMALGPSWLRVSGTWANKTYYDFDGHTGGKAPEGFENLLTRQQWDGVLDFVKDVGAELLISVANCPGIHRAQDPWQPEQAKLILDYSRSYGVPIRAAEFTNEPNMMGMAGLPDGYTDEQFWRDHDLFCRFIRENYPEIIIVGPCTTGDGLTAENLRNNPATNKAVNLRTTEQIFDRCKELVDVFSYHYYNGVSERGAAMGGHWPAEQALSEAYLAVAGEHAQVYAPMRDKYCPGGQMWVTESGDAGAGGNTWGSTYLDVFRTLNELGTFATVTDGVIFHNTLASSDYGLLQHGTFEPRPNYFAFLLWNMIMGNTVYDCGEPVREGAHVYAHSRKDGRAGTAYLIINNSLTEETVIELPTGSECYVLSAKTLRSRCMLLNGQPLCLNEDGGLPQMEPMIWQTEELRLGPTEIVFIKVD